ncbi:hypothetical protein [Actinopolymorpha singaporensis]|uniref:Uncharacterized protein n=1 Tax=Actinopolymorpha singaporensis TaxID=117157 RepID=A0A1H1LHY3_9ACTN|nr:hypothetical protein [Actinopolymorpha singaporensis]SDR74027.1 hypothetical protein SAMN04489717_0346 [Actinopolymorpha singaporensis]
MSARARRRRLTSTFTTDTLTTLALLAGLLTAFVVLARIGLADIPGALTFVGRLTGGLAVLAAVLVGVATLAVTDYRGRRRVANSGAAMLVGVLTVALSAVMLIAVGVSSGDYEPMPGRWLLATNFWLWLALLAWSAWALGLLHREHIWGQIPYPRRFALGVALTAGIAVVNFAYSQIYQPFALPVSVSASAEFGAPRLAPDRRTVFVPLSVTVRNRGSVPVHVLGTVYQVSGRLGSYTPDAGRPDRLTELLTGRSQLLRDTTVRGYELVGAGQLDSLRPGDRLEAGAETTEVRLVQVPVRAAYDALVASSQVTVLRGDRATIYGSYPVRPSVRSTGAPAWVAEPGVAYLKYHAAISQASHLLGVTREQKYVTLWWVLGSPRGRSPWPYLAATVASAHEEDLGGIPAYEQKVSSSYGLTTATSGTVEASRAALTPAP